METQASNIAVRRVALALPLGTPFGAQILEGIRRCIADRDRSWELVFPSSWVEPSRLFAEWSGAGLIVDAAVASWDAVAAELPCPLVGVSAAPVERTFTTITVDSRHEGRLAADHFLERGFRRFGYYGLSRNAVSRDRYAGYDERLAEAGLKCSILRAARSGLPIDWNGLVSELETWLFTLVPPVAVFAFSEAFGAQVLDACRELGLRVPQDVAVLTGADCPSVCEAANPPLSHVTRAGVAAGYQAAAALETLMSGTAPTEAVTVRGGSAIGRASTDTLGIVDPRLRRAVTRLRAQLRDPDCSVDPLIGELGVSRRWLEKAFEYWLRCPPYRYLSRERLRLAQEMLLERPQSSLGQVAAACGFRSQRQLYETFKRWLDLSPTQYLRAHSHGSPGGA